MMFEQRIKSKSTRLGMWMDSRMRRCIFRFGNVRRQDFVLDIGIGRGGLYTLCHEAGAFYCGIDSSWAVIKAAQKKYPWMGCIKASVPPIPKVIIDFDVIFMLHLLEHMPTATTAYDLCCHCHRVLKPGGRLVICVPDSINVGREGFNLDMWQHQTLTTLPNTREMMLDAGFKKVSARYMWLGFTSHCPVLLASGLCSFLPFRRLKTFCPDSWIVEKGKKLQDTLSRQIIIIGEK